MPTPANGATARGAGYAEFGDGRGGLGVRRRAKGQRCEGEAETRVRESKTGQNRDVQPFAVMDSTKNLPFLPLCEPDNLKMT